MTDEWWGPVKRFGHLPLLMLPSMESVVLQRDQRLAIHEATMTAVALGYFRERNGAYPDSLGELVPRYLPEMPVDRSTGMALRYKVVDGRPMLYGLGRDGVDGGGVWMIEPIYWPQVPETGDWVLYPPIEVKSDWLHKRNAK